MVGKEYEKIILSYLSTSYPTTKLIPNPQSRGADLISPIYWLQVEVKFDRRMEDTGNVFIEFEFKGTPSWIFKYPYLSLFAYGNNRYFYLFNANKLRKKITQFIKEGKYRIVGGWDWWYAKGILIPEADLLQNAIASRKFYL